MKKNEGLVYLLGMGIMAKIFIDMAVQMFNPFMAVIALGVGLSIVQMGQVVALSKFVGLLAPVLGHLADRWGYRFILRFCLLLAGFGFIGAVSFESIPLFIIALVLAGVGVTSFTPCLHAYLSNMLPYNKRAKGIATLEYSYALAGIFGLFLMGVLIENISWKAPFYLIGAGLIFSSFLFLTLPLVKRSGQETVGKSLEKKSLWTRFLGFIDLGDKRLSAWGNIFLSGLLCFSMLHILMVYGVWLQNDFDLSPIALGKVALLFGVFSLIGCTAVAHLTDKIGKRRSVISGMVVTFLFYGILPFASTQLLTSLIVLVIIHLGFEFSIVSNFSLLSEQVPSQRGKIMGMGAASGMLGTGLAGLTAPVAYLEYGVWGLGPVSMMGSLIGLLLLIFIIRE